MALVSMQEAKTHLRITDDDHDADIQVKADQASAIVVDYLKDRADDTWDETTTPLPVKAAALFLVGHLYEHRGDDLATVPGLGANNFDEAVWGAVGRLLARFRDPALA